MGFDSISNACVSAFSNKDLGKKKRTNRLAKLKQCKLDVRREQWLSQASTRSSFLNHMFWMLQILWWKEQLPILNSVLMIWHCNAVKNKECKMDLNGSESPPLSMRITKERNRSVENLEMRSRGEENEELSIDDSDMESVMNSPTDSSLGHNDSRKNVHASSCSSTSTSSGCCSESISEEEEDDGCLDDWEAVADALTADDKQHNQISELPAVPETKVGSTVPELHKDNSGGDFLKTESKGMVPGSPVTCQAWRPDDAFRPQSLPNLPNQNGFPVNSGCCSHGVNPWAWRSIISQPSSCPICYEDLDLTDSNFIPCSCGFRLCLFCHKRILEADGRCPGCRKLYDPINWDTGFNGGTTPFRMARSCSMSTRS